MAYIGSDMQLISLPRIGSEERLRRRLPYTKCESSHTLEVVTAVTNLAIPYLAVVQRCLASQIYEA